jgi:SAM-dependent methyltransferase
VKLRLLELLACPACTGELELSGGPGAEGAEEVEEGRLRCAGCQATYPISNGIPRLLPPAIGWEQERTAETFGWEWSHFVEMHSEYEAQFLDWIHPTPPEFFRDKAVLDAGCGIGRHAYFAASYGAREVVAMDISAAVETARRNLADLPNVHVVQADINNPPFKRPQAGGGFDFVYSIGVLHHLPDPRAGFESLLRVVRPGGTIFAWVYGHENNAVVHGFINPVRKIVTKHLGQRQISALSLPLTVLLQALVKGVYGPLRRRSVSRLLPSSAYLTSLSEFSFRQNHNIVFDQLAAPTAFYLKREDFQAWFLENGLEGVDISWRNENSWRGRGRVPAPVRTTARARA